MILPDKYTTLSESYLGISALILDVLLNKQMTIENLWECFDKKYSAKRLKNPPTYQKFLYVLEFMYLSKMINSDEKGVITLENIEAINSITKR